MSSKKMSFGFSNIEVFNDLSKSYFRMMGLAKYVAEHVSGRCGNGNCK